MAEKDKITGFIQQLYGEDKSKSLSKQDIMMRASSEIFPADVEIFFKELPEQEYDEGKLVDNLNAIITRRNRMKAIGGKLQI